VISEKLLCGKNAIVTGCARGIGKEILERFAYHGANLWACARNLTPEFDEYCKFLAQSYGVIVTPLCFDTRNLDEMRAAVKLLMKSELNVNGLVNNAGISLNALYQMTSERDLREQMEVNFFSPFLFTQYVVKLMLRHNGGSIVNIASSAAIDGNSGRAAYGASKAALLCATRALSRELGAQGVRANVIAPGITQTDMITNMSSAVVADTIAATDLRRIGNPSDIADVAVFLCSELASYITGQVIRVDGGM
jgi:3-oxoacyl-[acyl-carrier protein] reductase